MHPQNESDNILKVQFFFKNLLTDELLNLFKSF